MDIEYSNIYSLRVLPKSTSAFTSYKIHAQEKIIKSKTLQTRRKYPKLQLQTRWNLEYR